MKKRLLMGVLGGGLIVPALSSATVISFHDATHGYHYYGGYNVLMYGQGAAVDPGNNVWNGFGHYGGAGSTDFFGSGNPDSGHGLVPNGDPGNPYAWHSGTTASGTGIFSPTNSGASNVGNVNSDGTISPITLTMGYSADNGVGSFAPPYPTVTQGTASKIFSEAALASGTSVGTFSLADVPAGTYNLYLYGANFDGDRGATFTASSGTALGGFTSAINPGGGTQQTYILGTNYVEFTGVTPDSNGIISGTWSVLSNPITGQSGEGDFNGLQLETAAVPEPTSIALLGVAGITLLGRRRRRA